MKKIKPKKHMTNEEIFGDSRDHILKDFTIADQMRIYASSNPEEAFDEVLMREMPQLWNFLHGITK